jgi:hypothetical protein
MSSSTDRWVFVISENAYDLINVLRKSTGWKPQFIVGSQFVNNKHTNIYDIYSLYYLESNCK